MTMSQKFMNNSENTGRVTRPSLAQLKAVVNFIEQYPELAQRKLQCRISNEKFQQLWSNLSNIANSIDGARKTVRGWIKFWSDKRRSVTLKNRQIKQGKVQDRLTALEQRILKLCTGVKAKKNKEMKQEPCNGDESSMDDDYLKNGDIPNGDVKLLPTECDERNFNVMDTMIDAMSKQAMAVSQLAQASLAHSKAMQQIAEASHKQALAADRLATTFESICGSAYEVRNAIMGINYTIKGCYSANAQNRQNSNLFS
ncbi:uncharacterized protein LOC119829529 [Zerene cesonia]|uniref:uncharacterized protein LOC119829529 n=1 Tax=Zerene cesonia TaxID=33412 RepID=UPI0018E55288|nr:uncharacterized protein LOC119829529 [Zerene cesonia]